jgi:type II secretory pathway predicted ATPase ExeA
MNLHEHFGLSRPPFEMVGQPKSLYMSKSHREGLAALEWGLLHEPGNFTLLMGEVGTGKTTLINVLLGRHYDLARIAYVMNPKLGFEEMLRVVLEQLGYLPNAATKLELLKKFERVFAQLRPKERIAIIVDEAQALSDETLEELRLFSNYARDSKGHLEIMLVGQPELLTRLMAPSLRQFHQRIGARAVLNRLRREEALEYIDHKLRDAGGAANAIFDKSALGEIVDRSQGIPRQLNLLCNNALIRAYAVGLRRVTLKIVRAAIGEYDNLATGVEEFHHPLLRPALRSIIAHPAISLTSLGVIALAGLCFLGVRQSPKIELLFRSETNPSLVKATVAQKSEGNVNAVSHIPTDSGTSPDETAASSSPNDGEASERVVDDASAPRSMPGASVANPSRNTGPLTPPSSGPNDSEAAKLIVDDASVVPRSMPSASVANPRRNAGSTSRETLAYSVQSGDTIEGITLRHFGSKAKTKSVIQANPQLRNVNRIYPGDTVFLPAESATRNEDGTR